jgi:hypothetical protein
MTYHNTGFHKERAERLQWIKEYLEATTEEGSIEYNNVLTKVMFKYGLRTKTANEHLDFVIEMIGFRRIDGKIMKPENKA